MNSIEAKVAVRTANTIKTIMEKLSLPKGLSIKAVPEWFFPGAPGSEIYVPHRPAERIMLISHKGVPLGTLIFFVDKKNIKIDHVQGESFKNREYIKLERPWTETLMNSFLIASFPLHEKTYSIKFNEPLVHDLISWKRQLNEARLEKNVAKEKYYEYQLKVYNSIRDNYFTKKDYFLSLEKNMTKKIYECYRQLKSDKQLFMTIKKPTIKSRQKELLKKVTHLRKPHLH